MISLTGLSGSSLNRRFLLGENAQFTEIIMQFLSEMSHWGFRYDVALVDNDHNNTYSGRYTQV